MIDKYGEFLRISVNTQVIKAPLQSGQETRN